MKKFPTYKVTIETENEDGSRDSTSRQWSDASLTLAEAINYHSGCLPVPIPKTLTYVFAHLLNNFWGKGDYECLKAEMQELFKNYDGMIFTRP